MACNWPKRINQTSRKESNVLEILKRTFRCTIHHQISCPSPFLAFSLMGSLSIIKIIATFSKSSWTSWTLENSPIIRVHYYSLYSSTEYFCDVNYCILPYSILVYISWTALLIIIASQKGLCFTSPYILRNVLEIVGAQYNKCGRKSTKLLLSINCTRVQSCQAFSFLWNIAFLSHSYLLLAPIP